MIDLSSALALVPGMLRNERGEGDRKEFAVSLLYAALNVDRHFEDADILDREAFRAGLVKLVDAVWELKQASAEGAIQ